MLHTARWIYVEGITFEFHRLPRRVSFLLYFFFYDVMRILGLLCPAKVKMQCIKRNISENSEKRMKKGNTKIFVFVLWLGLQDR